MSCVLGKATIIIRKIHILNLSRRKQKKKRKEGGWEETRKGGERR